MQPGVFALSGWDLVGALTLPAAAVRERLADGDTRWINRGAYDLLGSNPQATRSAAGIAARRRALRPAAAAAARSPTRSPPSWRACCKVRADLHLYAARLVDVPSVQAKGLLVLVHELPENAGTRSDGDQLRGIAGG